jgi:succinate-acetate transporter protein
MKKPKLAYILVFALLTLLASMLGFINYKEPNTIMTTGGLFFILIMGFATYSIVNNINAFKEFKLK